MGIVEPLPLAVQVTERLVRFYVSPCVRSNECLPRSGNIGLHQAKVSTYMEVAIFVTPRRGDNITRSITQRFESL